MISATPDNVENPEPHLKLQACLDNLRDCRLRLKRLKCEKALAQNELENSLDDLGLLIRQNGMQSERQNLERGYANTKVVRPAKDSVIQYGINRNLAQLNGIALEDFDSIVQQAQVSEPQHIRANSDHDQETTSASTFIGVAEVIDHDRLGDGVANAYDSTADVDAEWGSSPEDFTFLALNQDSFVAELSSLNKDVPGLGLYDDELARIDICEGIEQTPFILLESPTEQTGPDLSLTGLRTEHEEWAHTASCGVSNDVLVLPDVQSPSEIRGYIETHTSDQAVKGIQGSSVAKRNFNQAFGVNQFDSGSGDADFELLASSSSLEPSQFSPSSSHDSSSNSRLIPAAVAATETLRTRLLAPKPAPSSQPSAPIPSIWHRGAELTKKSRRCANRPDRTKARNPRKKRQRFTDIHKKQQTASMRQIGACEKCHNQKDRCETNLDDPEDPCSRCARLIEGQPKLRCIRWHLANLSLHRDQQSPWPEWTARYNDMNNASDISHWKDSEIKALTLSHGMPGATYKLHVRRFVPQPGDMLYETWFDRSLNCWKRHSIQPYAVVNMVEFKREVYRYVKDSIPNFVIGVIQKMCGGDEMLKQTYRMAIRRCYDHRVRNKERQALYKALCLWVGSRVNSLPETAVGEDKIASRVDDPSSPYYGLYPIAPVIYSQQETVMFTQIMRPLQRQLLEELDALLRGKKKESWLTIYLCLFVLLHSCSLTCRRDAEFAVQMASTTRFANPESIFKNRIGVTTLISHFHRNKGHVPFMMCNDPDRINELAAVAELDQEQLRFVQQTSKWVRERQHVFQEAKSQRDPTKDFYYVFQLSDPQWHPLAESMVN